MIDCDDDDDGRQIPVYTARLLSRHTVKKEEIQKY